MKHYIARTPNGAVVYVDLIQSKAAANIAQRPQLLSLVKEALERTNVRGPAMDIEKDMGREIGYDFIVETTDKDTILYAQILPDVTYTRLVKNAKPNPTRMLTLRLRRQQDGTYELHETWVGVMNPALPGSEDETAASKSFWENHALVLRDQWVPIRNATKVCPY